MVPAVSPGRSNRCASVRIRPPEALRLGRLTASPRFRLDPESIDRRHVLRWRRAVAVFVPNGGGCGARHSRLSDRQVSESRGVRDTPSGIGGSYYVLLWIG